MAHTGPRHHWRSTLYVCSIEKIVVAYQKKKAERVKSSIVFWVFFEGRLKEYRPHEPSRSRVHFIDTCLVFTSFLTLFQTKNLGKVFGIENRETEKNTRNFSVVICHGALLSHSMFETNWESTEKTCTPAHTRLSKRALEMRRAELLDLARRWRARARKALSVLKLLLLLA